MSAVQPAVNPRRLLSERQTSTVTALLDAALAELRKSGFDQLSLRSVAHRAGVTHTTAYSYFTSKSHLIAELHWRQLQHVPSVRLPTTASFSDRVRAAFSGPATAMANEPALAEAVLSAFVTNEPNVLRVRDAIGRELSARVSAALGDQDQPKTHVALLTHYSGAMLVAGMLTHDFLDVIEQMDSLAHLVDHG
ncbi:MAG: helix-turn-helix domain-containing protein [Acidimicrobiales bacterium]|jgi:AcrR family transcriptional regulator